MNATREPEYTPTGRYQTHHAHGCVFRESTAGFRFLP